MIKRISCLIISPNSENEDYSNLGYDDGMNETEKKFDLFTSKNIEEALEILSNNQTIDCIVSVGYNSRLFGKYAIDTNIPCLFIGEYDSQLINNFIIQSFFNKLDIEYGPKFSFFTSIYNTSKRQIERLYNSLVNQTINSWEWVIIDDSTNNDASDYIRYLNDYRISIYKNITSHGIIGNNKHNVAMLCNGEWLIEIDHDDEVVPTCLEEISNAIEQFPDTDFIYSDCLELLGNTAINYGDSFSLGQGTYRDEVINGKKYKVVISTPTINPKSIRAIYAEPNHVRVWRKDFYQRIGGHNKNLSVLDDMDLMIRTFLNGKMTHINKVLYIQHEDGSVNGRGDTAQGHRFAEIQRTNWLLYNHYDKQIHERILQLGYEDTIWNEDKQCSEWWIDADLPCMSNEYYP